MAAKKKGGRGKVLASKKGGGKKGSRKVARGSGSGG